MTMDRIVVNRPNFQRLRCHRLKNGEDINENFLKVPIETFFSLFSNWCCSSCFTMTSYRVCSLDILVSNAPNTQSLGMLRATTHELIEILERSKLYRRAGDGTD